MHIMGGIYNVHPTFEYLLFKKTYMSGAFKISIIFFPKYISQKGLAKLHRKLNWQASGFLEGMLLFGESGCHP